MVNPTLRKGRGTRKSDEACLSIPGIYGIVPERYEIVDIEYYDQEFNHKKARLRGFDAVIFLHEFDHLNGVLYTDRMTKEGQEAVKEKLFEIEKGIYKANYEMIFTHL